MRTEVGTRHVYLSYCNVDYEFVLQFAIDLRRVGIPIWCDRFAVEPTQVWGESILQAIEDAESAILVISRGFFDSRYCQQELGRLKNRKIPLYAVIINDVPLESVKNALTEINLVNFSDWQDPNTYTRNVNELIELLGAETEPEAALALEQEYLVKLIGRLELALLSSAASGVALKNHWGLPVSVGLVRPRGYAFDALLQQGQYLLQEAVSQGETFGPNQGSELVIADMLNWLNVRPHMVLVGDAGYGKTYLLYLLVLQAAHKRLNYGAPYALPILLDLVLWDKVQEFHAFLESRWPLSKTFLDWTLEDQVSLFLDGLSEIPVDRIGRAANLREWLEAGRASAVVVTSRVDSYREQNLNLPLVRMPVLAEPQVRAFADAYLASNYVESFMEYLRLNDTEGAEESVYHNLTFITFQMMLFQAEVAQSIPQRPGEIIGEVVHLLWDQADRTLLGHFTREDVEHALEALAYTMQREGYRIYIPRQAALEAIGNEMLILAGLYLGFLDDREHYLRFNQQVLQTYFAARALQREGVYSQLAYPQFDAQGLRRGGLWDDVVGMLLGTMSPTDAVLTLQTIADVDPYLVFEQGKDYLNLEPGFLPEWIEKFFEPRYDHVRSLDATRAIMRKLEPSERVATTLVKIARGADWANRQSASSILIDLPVQVSDSFAAQVEGLDREFPDASYDFSAQYDTAHLTAMLINLTAHYRDQIRLNAIWLLGEQREKAAVAPLLALLRDDDGAIVAAAAESLGKIRDPAAFPQLARLAADLTHESTKVASKALQELGRGLSARVIRVLSESGEWVSPELIRQLAAVDDQIVAVAIATEYDNSTPLTAAAVKALEDREVAEKVRKLLDIMAQRMQVLRTRDAFNEFVDEMKGSLSVAQQDDLSNQSAATLKKRIKAEQATVGRERHHVPQSQSVLSGEEKGVLSDKLILALEHEEWLIRLQAVQHLENVDSRAALPHLMKAAKDADSQVRIAAIETIDSLRDFPVVLDVLMEALDDPEAAVIDAAADRLKERGTAVVYGLVRRLNTENVNSLAAMIEILGHVGDKSVIPYLRPFLMDTRKPWMGEKTIGDITAQTLLSVGTQEALAAVQQAGFVSQQAAIHIIPPDIDTPRRGKNRLAPVEKIKLAFKALRGEDWESAQKAARYLREYAKRLRGRADESITILYTRSLDDPNWVVRWTAVESLAWLQVPDVAKQIVQRLHDANWTVQIAAIRTLVELGAKDTVTDIATLLADDNSTVREAAAEAVGIIGTEDMLDHLSQVLHDPDEFVRLAALQSVRAIASEKSKPLMLEALQDDYSHVRWFAIQTLSETATEDLVPHFSACLHDLGGPSWESKTISDFAAEGLRRIHTPESQAALQEWLRSGESPD